MTFPSVLAPSTHHWQWTTHLVLFKSVGDAWLREDAKANNSDVKYEGMATKVGCYCYGQNCFGNEYDIGCWYCVDLAMKNGELPAKEVDNGVCCFDCNIC